MTRFIGTRSTANYRSIVFALLRISPFGSTFRVRRLMSRCWRAIRPSNLEPPTYAFEELLESRPRLHGA
jgi:hypothetical protein